MRAPEFWAGRGPWATSMPPLLSPLSGLYDGLGRLRRALAKPAREDHTLFEQADQVLAGVALHVARLGIGALELLLGHIAIIALELLLGA